MTLEELINERRSLRPLTKKAYLSAISDFTAFAGRDPSGWTPASARAWLQHEHLRVTNGEVKPQTLNRKIYALRSVSKLWARFHQDPDRLHFAQLLERLPRVEPTAKKFALSYEDAQRLIDTCRGERPQDLRDRAMMVIGFKTGMRRMSLAHLEFERMDWAANRVEIFVKRGRMHRVPPLDAETFAALEPWRDWLRSHGVRSGRFFRGLYGLGALGKDAKAVRESISMEGIHKVLCGRAADAGIAFTTHTFRHTFVTWMQMLKQPGYVIQAYTGHRSDAMVVDYTDAWLAVTGAPPMATFELKV